MRMKENWGKNKILKIMMAGGLLFNNFSGLGLIINAATIEQNENNSLLNGNANEESNVVNNDTTPDDSIGGNDSEEMTPILPGDGTIEGDSNDPQKPEVDQPEIPEVEVPSEDDRPVVSEPESPSEEETENSDSNLSEDDAATEDSIEGDEEEIALEEESELFSLENRSAGSGLVQLWQVVPAGQDYKEGKTTSEIMKALQCRPNHSLYSAGGQTEHNTYVNSCYVDDAFYLGEEGNYYKIYLSGYEGKVPKSESHWFELDLNGDGKKVSYEIQTVAYYIPGASIYTLNEEETTEILDVPELNYYDQTLDKYSDIDEKSIELYASSTVQSPSYYANENGTLIHYVTNNVTKAGSYSKVTAGKAPSWMSSGVKYYSYDGIYFYNNWRNIRVNGQGAVNQNNPFYSYYQYLPFRSKSNYSAGVFNNYTNSSGGAGGKLVNTGQYFYAVQDKYGINGALQYAMGIHESGWGKSSLSIDKNNLFGMNATDNNPYGNGTSFPSVEAGINYHADRYLSWGYTDPIDDARYFGSHVGNKGSGMNVKYASDPFWGEKIAGWYYRFDNASGLKDYDNYTIGIKQSNVVYNIRSQATTSSSVLYQTKNKKSNLKIANYPVLIIGEQNGFYKIQTDTPIIDGKAQFNAQYIRELSVGYIDKASILVTNQGAYEEYGALHNHIDQVSIDANGLYLYGWGYVEGLNMSNDWEIEKNIVIKNESGTEVIRQTVEDIYNLEFAQGFNGPYEYARYGTFLPILNLEPGIYNFDIEIEKSGYGKRAWVRSNYKLDTGYVQIDGKKYRFYNEVESGPVKLEIIEGELQNHIDQVSIDANGLYLYGWGYVEGLNMSNDWEIEKNIVIKNESGTEVIRQTVEDIYNLEFAQGFNGPYEYARYGTFLPILNLEPGIYNFDIEIEKSGYGKRAWVRSNYKLDTGYVQIDGKKYRFYNEVESGPVKLEIIEGELQNHIDQVNIDANGLYLYGWGYVEGLNMSNDWEIEKNIVVKNENGTEVIRQTVEDIYNLEFAQGFNGPYEYARYGTFLPILNLEPGIYNFDIEIVKPGYGRRAWVRSNYKLDTGYVQIGEKKYRFYNEVAQGPVHLSITY